MKCLTPVYVRNPAYNSVYGHSRDNSSFFYKYPCRKCVNCLKNYLNMWMLRFEFESDSSFCSSFVTLTYSDENRPDSVSKDHIINFHRRLKYALRDSDYPVRYCIISEYTPLHSYPHYHGLYFNVPSYLFESLWKFGFVDVRDVIPERIVYVCSYHLLKNFNVPQGKLENFRFMSNGIGLKGFLDNYGLENASSNNWLFLLNNNLVKCPIHPYFKNKFGIHLDPVFEDPIIRSKQETIDYYSAVNISTRNFLIRKLISKGF